MQTPCFGSVKTSDKRLTEKDFSMEAKAVVRTVRMSPRKMRVVANLVRGKKVGEAMALLKLMPKKGAFVIRKLLISAVANAEQ